VAIVSFANGAVAKLVEPIGERVEGRTQRRRIGEVHPASTRRKRSRSGSISLATK
jgi:hypothetical protein